ncbi:FecCD family ABC transporter permease [Cumulibacter soli]|uniref:FecCD family ABC transporter permease n=1 Tax=Cumulibacter soli TaxID=2546344 RepID=UPI001FBB6FC3|nr:iron chelate uptake ABC transporter family permease subunit [Cumulibacter soli]
MTTDTAPRRRTTRMPDGRPAVRLGVGAVRVQFTLRTGVVVGALLIVALIAAILALRIGDYPLTLTEVLSALAGDNSQFSYVVVMEWRLPRTIAGLVFGAALGVSGALFQSLTRNPLGSPDVIGLSAGSYTGALVALIFVGSSATTLSTGGLIGGFLTAALIYLFAYRRGTSRFRLIIVGIGLSAMLTAANNYLLLVANLDLAMVGAAWGAGSIDQITWSEVTPPLVVIAVALLLCIVASRPLGAMALGDDAARAFGIKVEKARGAIVLLAVALTAVVAATAGPIAFVALAAPQLARRMTASAGIALVPSAAMGACLLCVSDFVAAQLFGNIPVGLVTVGIGGVYLVWLLIHESRRSA